VLRPFWRPKRAGYWWSSSQGDALFFFRPLGLDFSEKRSPGTSVRDSLIVTGILAEIGTQSYDTGKIATLSIRPVSGTRGVPAWLASHFQPSGKKKSYAGLESVFFGRRIPALGPILVLKNNSPSSRYGSPITRGAPRQASLRGTHATAGGSLFGGTSPFYAAASHTAAAPPAILDLLFFITGGRGAVRVLGADWGLGHGPWDGDPTGDWGFADLLVAFRPAAMMLSP